MSVNYCIPSNNYILGCSELVIRFRDGIFHVWELEDEEHKTVFTGHFEECLEYCKKREIDYMESIVG